MIYYYYILLFKFFRRVLCYLLIISIKIIFYIEIIKLKYLRKNLKLFIIWFCYISIFMY